MNYKIIQESLDKDTNKIQIIDLPRVYDLAQLMRHFFIEHKQTTYASNNTTQCSAKRHRSIEDLYLIAKNYFPGITLEKCANATEKLYKNILGHHFCSTVKRIVHWPTRIDITAIDIRIQLGELNVKNPQYKKVKKKTNVKISSPRKTPK